jgi:hypothetical protein
MVHNTQNYRVSGLCSSSVILNIRRRNFKIMSWMMMWAWIVDFSSLRTCVPLSVSNTKHLVARLLLY